MPRIRFNGTGIPVASGQTVLDALLSAGNDVPYSCKNGICLSCMMRGVEGRLPAAAQNGIKETLRAQNYFLPCVAVTESDLAVALPLDADVYGRAVIRSRELLAPDICRVRLQPATPLYYHAGQFINLRRGDGLIRSYSLASVPHRSAELEMHVRRLRNGAMSNWIFDTALEGETIDLQGPNGGSFYVPGRPEQPMLLVGSGTGLAPLLGIAEDALHSGHSGDVRLYHGSRRAAGLYLGKRLHGLEAEFANFRYVPCVSGDKPPPGVRAARADAAALADQPQLRNWRVFLCGNPPMVHTARTACYLGGAALADIHADPFECKDLRATPRN
ncbi:MAG: FAD-binding oxidoreductase [Proteobacteria bacterium]|nr:FAD-binding oxidoreductase [Pseudomonadota bacterium]